MSSTPANPGYTYYSSSVTSQDLERSRKNCAELSRLRLNPPISDLDYLTFKLRASIIKKWCAHLDGSELLVLDIGGRIQPYRPLLKDRTRHYIGVDLALEGLVDVISDGTCLPFADSSVDVVFCNDTLQYIPEPSRAIAEIHRVLRPGGRLILSTRSSFPEHHDEHWRFFPIGLRYLTRAFSSVEIEPEGNSAVGVAIFVNDLLHRYIGSYRLRRIAQLTSIPSINLLGSLLSHVRAKQTRGTCGYSLLAIK